MLTLIVLASCGLLLLVIIAWWYLGRGLDRYDFSSRLPGEPADQQEQTARPTSAPKRETRKTEQHA